MQILALDLSLAATGVCRSDGTLETWTPPKGCRGVERLAWFVDALSDVLSPPESHAVPLPASKMGAGAIQRPSGAQRPSQPVTLVVIEDLPHGLRNSAAGPLGELHGVIKLRLHDDLINTLLIPPATLKKYATGRGNATKPDMRMELYKRTQLDLADDNQVDAWWLRALALDHAGTPLLAMPATHRAALTKLAKDCS